MNFIMGRGVQKKKAGRELEARTWDEMPVGILKLRGHCLPNLGRVWDELPTQPGHSSQPHWDVTAKRSIARAKTGKK
jgi:hypothetical protein